MHNILLNIKTDYELLSSLIKIKDLISYAKKNNITVLGVTDSNLLSFMEFYESCKNSDIKPIVGIDITVDNKKFILYAKNFKGYQNLCKIVSEKNINGLNEEIINKYKSNLICVCFKEDYEYLSGIYDLVYIRYENNLELNKIKSITNNVLYMNEVLCFNESDYKYLNYLYMIKDSKTVADNINYRFNNNYINLKISEFDRNTNINFSDLINIELPKFNFNLPKYTNNSLQFLKELCYKGLNKRLNSKVDSKYIKRLDYELSIIESTGFVDYFLIVYDIVLYAKKNNIYVGPGRGSAVSSLVSYSLGIIDIDPLKYNLLFERFLNPSRVSMPDIDIDISDTKRDMVINYVKEKYGKDKVGNIITFSTLLPKQVLRDTGKILNINTNKLDGLISLLNDNESLESLENKNKYKDLIKFNKEYISLLEISKHLEGLKKHPSIHAAGVVIDSEELTNKVPLLKSGDNIIVGYDKHYIEDLGILKIDLLSIRNLSIIEEILDEVSIETGKKLNLNNIPLDDQKTLELFRKGDTTGIFQYESAGMRNLIKKMNVSSFNDLVVSIAMFRPGPIKMIPLFLKRKNKEEKITYPSKELEPILKETLGIMVYQEQLLEILKVMGGYSYAEADIIRSAIKNKDESILLKEKTNFKIRSKKLGYDELTIDNVYNMIMKFASYGFNKSHSVAYAFVAYQMGYLKANYPHIFMMNLLNKEIGRELKTKEYIDESKILGLSFKNVDINLSVNKYYRYKKEIIFPLNVVKGISFNVAEEIIKIRKNGEFKDFIDFVSRCYSKVINKKVIESLIMIGAFDKFKINRKTLIENLEAIINYAVVRSQVGGDYLTVPELINYDEYDDNYLLELEKELLGFYNTHHPVTRYKRTDMINTQNLHKYFDKNIHIIMLVESIKEIKTKNKEAMAFLKLSDEYGNIDGVIFPSYYRKIYDKLKKLQVIDIFCKVEKRLNEYQLVINNIEILSK